MSRTIEEILKDDIDHEPQAGLVMAHLIKTREDLEERLADVEKSCVALAQRLLALSLPAQAQQQQEQRVPAVVSLPPPPPQNETVAPPPTTTAPPVNAT